MTCPNCDLELNSPERIIKTNKDLTRCAKCNDTLIGRIGQLCAMPRVLILGIDGYIGWPLAINLLNEGYAVAGIDNLSRRKLVNEIGSDSLTPITSYQDRMDTLRMYSNFTYLPGEINLHSNMDHISLALDEFKPDTIIHLAEQPSAPYSMRGPYESASTQHTNVIGNLNLLWAMREAVPKAHLIKLGSMGEYGTPDCLIPEGMIPEKCLANLELKSLKCPMQGLPFPKSPHSFYHLSKVHDTNNIIFACKTWGLTSTDIMQGVVYGLTDIEPSLVTRFDYDQYFGTVLNRFCAQAISDHPLTVYGTGQQIRGYLPLKDSIQCIKLAIDNPPKLGTYRTFNQYESTYSVQNLANIVARRSKLLGLKPDILYLSNPRTEKSSHIYKPTSKALRDLGYEPTTDIKHEVHNLLAYLIQYAHRVNSDVIRPTTTWR